MDIKQIIELWTSLSPRLAGGIGGQNLAKDECVHGKKKDEDNEDRKVDSMGSRHVEDDV